MQHDGLHLAASSPSRSAGSTLQTFFVRLFHPPNDSTLAVPSTAPIQPSEQHGQVHCNYFHRHAGACTGESRICGCCRLRLRSMLVPEHQLLACCMCSPFNVVTSCYCRCFPVLQDQTTTFVHAQPGSHTFVPQGSLSPRRPSLIASGAQKTRAFSNAGRRMLTDRLRHLRGPQHSA